MLAGCLTKPAQVRQPSEGLLNPCPELAEEEFPSDAEVITSYTELALEYRGCKLGKDKLIEFYKAR